MDRRGQGGRFGKNGSRKFPLIFRQGLFPRPFQVADTNGHPRPCRSPPGGVPVGGVRAGADAQQAAARADPDRREKARGDGPAHGLLRAAVEARHVPDAQQRPAVVTRPRPCPVGSGSGGGSRCGGWGGRCGCRHGFPFGGGKLGERADALPELPRTGALGQRILHSNRWRRARTATRTRHTTRAASLRSGVGGRGHDRWRSAARRDQSVRRLVGRLGRARARRAPARPVGLPEPRRRPRPMAAPARRPGPRRRRQSRRTAPGRPIPNSRDTSRHFGSGEGGDARSPVEFPAAAGFTRAQISGVTAWRHSGRSEPTPDQTARYDCFEQFRVARTQRPQVGTALTNPRTCTVVGSSSHRWLQIPPGTPLMPHVAAHDTTVGNGPKVSRQARSSHSRPARTSSWTSTADFTLGRCAPSRRRTETRTRSRRCQHSHRNASGRRSSAAQPRSRRGCS